MFENKETETGFCDELPEVSTYLTFTSPSLVAPTAIPANRKRGELERENSS